MPNYDPQQAADLVRKWSVAHQSLEDENRFELRTDLTSSMPDAVFHAEPSVIYYCDYGGQGSKLLGALVVALTSTFRAVTLEDWE